jgi:hypothetical protein
MAQRYPPSAHPCTSRPNWLSVDNQFGELRLGVRASALLRAPAARRGMWCFAGRGGLGIDRDHDEADRAAGRQVQCPTLLLESADDRRRGSLTRFATGSSTAGTIRQRKHPA